MSLFYLTCHITGYIHFNIFPFSLGHSSVTVVIYNKTKQTLVLVKQLRPAVLFAELMNDASIDNVNDIAKINESLKGEYVN